MFSSNAEQVRCATGEIVVAAVEHLQLELHAERVRFRGLKWQCRHRAGSQALNSQPQRASG